MMNGKITNIIEIYPIPGEEFSSMEEGGGVLVRVSKPSVFGTEKEPKIPILTKTTTSI